MSNPQKVFISGEYVPLLTVDPITGDKQPAKECCCACCEYPWPGGSSGWNTGDFLYPPDDLPEEVEVSLDGGETWTTLVLTASDASTFDEYPFYSLPSGGVPFPDIPDGLFISPDGSIFGTFANGFIVGRKVTEGDPPQDVYYLVAGSSTGCLIGTCDLHDEDLDPTYFGTAIVRDLFPSTYAVNGSVTITRTEGDICGEWIGDGYILYYNPTIYKWQLNGVSKTGSQNNPAGTYGSDTVS